ncbi:MULTISPECIES: outer membrane lipoprotein carrier protein LolA [unclassified Lentimicrobium]|uniref:LolA family protein n=1 Tax=unclassified Lentimicrobium TaxID=2677434 RepID=UPI001557FBBD|nr:MULTISPECIES: outer membrane lipoprotein carrier protein LolA [unclassified Lentimicrobium]NPD45956.1 outer membrane lipoprotein carrier protein LolA [Lentimicrobium sp. S6]NPD84277.1 outer membrane lipoprotein carrier protein LolA [Lentimicrobium sp. L6]
MKKGIQYMIILAISLSFMNMSFAQKAEDILEELSTKTNSYKNIKTSFAYKMVNLEAEIDETTNGTLIVAGNKYHLNIAGQEVICDGETLWTYLADSEEVQVNEVSDDEGFSPTKLLSSYNDDYTSKLGDDIIKEGVSFYQLNLKPKDKNSNFDYVVLSVNKELLQLSEFTMYDFDGNIFSYEIKQFVTDSEIPSDSFTFDTAKYPNVDVIDMR